ncbi:hypothetical protein SGRA_4201 [Saprospira grandis str. Lewin]|uniref:Uncharacterized protein n=1 Tax=Saprospira grandis (strain Lewin) TaxID=984262 RepID=H6L8W0_SAPGL|nr:hypothetical protein SGRA_4201 [Saprospira grandis str. Lewin]
MWRGKLAADRRAQRAAGLAMCSSAAKPQTQAVRPQGRANSELRNVAPAKGGRPQNSSELQNDNKNFSSQFDDQRK